MDSQKRFPIAEFVQSLSQRKVEDYNAMDWLLWPPDIFLITSILLQRTGCYRIALIELDSDWLDEWQREPGSWTKAANNAPLSSRKGNVSKRFYWESNNWEEDIKQGGTAWINAAGYAATRRNMGSWEEINKNIEGDEEISGQWTQTLNRLESIWQAVITSEQSIETLRIISSDSYDSLSIVEVPNASFTEKQFVECRELAMLLVWIHALADEACIGFGLVSQFHTTNLNDFHFTRRIRSFAKMKANLLLISTGSLSTISKFHGVVLPKMRTPQVGFILRSMSHHLTYHVTEVEVIWRTIPWLNAHEKALNILAFPYPYSVSDNDFQVVDDQYHSVRYFQPNFKNPNQGGYAFLESLIDMVFNLHKAGTTIHIIIFPETALREKEYRHMLTRFHKELEEDSTPKTFKLPMIIAGVVGFEGELDEKDGGEASNAPAKTERPYVNNEVRVASYFAGRWYEAKQRKHHRWQLDRKQIRQYDLQGILTTEKKWFEYTAISQRRLTFLAPNDWLVITSLICEDLARLEPVSEIIRGVGPTFLIALLSDGPQLTERWPARYASVLADDPGTAVLSFTSYGMAARSKPDNTEVHSLANDGTVVGLWRDAVTGFKAMKASQANTAQLITVSADFQFEKTLDARSDGGKAPSFKIDKVKEILIEPAREKKAGELRNGLGNWDDIRQLSVFVFTLDAAIDLLLMTINNKITATRESKKDHGKLQERFGHFWEEILSILLLKKNEPNSDSKHQEVSKYEAERVESSRHALQDMLFDIQHSLQQPLNYGVGVKSYDDTWPTKDVEHAYSMATRIFDNVTKEIEGQEKTHSVTTVLCILFAQAENAFEKEQKEMTRGHQDSLNTRQIRIRQAVPIAMVMAIDNKISNLEINQITDIAKLKMLRLSIRKFLDDSYKRVRSAK